MKPGQVTRVVIAEDETLVSERIREVVETAGYTVIGEAFDGQQAVEMTASLRPDVVLMDIAMPGMDGLEAARNIQAHCPTPVVVLTAHQTPDLVEQAGQSGIGAYLIKPPDARELQRAVTIAIARFEDMRELRRLNEQLQIEIRERIRAEEQLRHLLKEREALVKEVYHRVKNNFMTMSSFLALQADTTENKEARQLLQESVNYTTSLSMIHERLCNTGNLVSIDAGEYLSSVILELFHAYRAFHNGLMLDSNWEENIILPADKAIPCGMLVNELVSNALKYAFPDRRQGTIRFELHERDHQIILILGDNGVGLPEELDLSQVHSLGMSLSLSFIKQLRGRFTVERSPGTTYTITFPNTPERPVNI